LPNLTTYLHELSENSNVEKDVYKSILDAFNKHLEIKQDTEKQRNNKENKTIRDDDLTHSAVLINAGHCQSKISRGFCSIK